LNRADPRGQDNDDAAQVLKETDTLDYTNMSLGNRKAFSNAAAQGLAVTELKPGDPKASEEIVMLYRYVFDLNAILQRNVAGR